jgi:hypothetical protein
MTVNEAQAQTEPKTEAVTTTEVQEPAPIAPVTQGQGSGPWANDLNSLFEDEGVRGQVDTFLRDKVQPYVTQLEQRSKPSEEQELAYQLYEDFQSDPSSTYLAITEELFGEDGAIAIQRALAESYAVDDETPIATPTQTSADPRVLEAVDYIERQRAQEAYDSDVGQLAETDPDLDRDLLHPFVVAADGDIQAAYERYRHWYDGVKSKFVPAEEPVEAEAPAVIGSDVQTPAAPPTQKTYSSLDDALDDFFAEERGSAPPVVGAV